jgi:lipopolysaccharide/colanic/teichoic acid biosynthesis glycosyltransferase
MNLTKRLFDLAAVLFFVIVLAVPFSALLIYLLLKEGRPFYLWKLRTMRVVATDSGVSGGDKSDRVTPMGRMLRKYRLDEIPQLWNVLRGDMSFVGPRPPLRSYVERFPEIYAQVLQSRPGVTGLATLHFHRHEELLLRSCKTAAETDAVYTRRCIPRKARLDLIYRDRQSFCMDIALMVATVKRVGRRQRADEKA